MSSDEDYFEETRVTENTTPMLMFHCAMDRDTEMHCTLRMTVTDKSRKRQKNTFKISNAFRRDDSVYQTQPNTKRNTGYIRELAIVFQTEHSSVDVYVVGVHDHRLTWEGSIRLSSKSLN